MKKFLLFLSVAFGFLLINSKASAQSIVYNPSAITLTTGIAANIVPTITAPGGGYTLNSVAIAPALVANGTMAFSTTSGDITGTPTTAATVKTYVVTATFKRGGATQTANQTITITIVAPPVFTYPTPQIYTQNTAITTIGPTVTSGTITSYAISAALPTGLAFSTTTGQISGTPTVVSGTTTYTITGTASNGGIGTTTITITVNPAAPNITYTSPDTYTAGTAIPTLSPTNTGGTSGVTYTTTGLPAGLAISPTTGAITGTPTTTAGIPATNYSVTATNVTGSSTFNINITINPLPAPIITYTSPDTYTANVAITALNPTNAGGGLVTYSTTGLPPGLNLNTTTGAITGTPTTLAGIAATSYAVTATNATGSSTFNITITINEAAPIIAYTTPDTYTSGVAITPLTPNSTGGPVTTYTTTGLPAGLSLDPSTGIISGTPTTIAGIPAANYTVTATNSTGSSTATIRITIIEAAPNITYTTPDTYTSGTAIATLSPTNTGGTTGVTYTTTGLPPGLAISATTGAITGTPTTSAGIPAANYSVTATNAGGSSTFLINITINPVPAPIITYTSPDTYTANVAIATLNPTNTGGGLVTYSTTGLPPGLNLNTTTGAITGTPTTLTGIAATSYAVTATNAGGSSTFNITITINEAAPIISYTTPDTYTANVAITPLTPNSTGGPVTTYTTTGLPAGLSLDPTTGIISGTPTTLAGIAATNYYVTATNTTGSSTATIRITITVAAPNITYSSPAPTYVFTQGTALTGATEPTPTNTGGPLTGNAYTETGTLPNGLNFSRTTGIITGTPTTANATPVSITVTATNAGGSSSATFTITVNPKAPVITYAPNTANTWTIGTAYSITPNTAGGGTVSTWSYTGTLPPGVTFNTTNGVISGTPTTPPGSYSVTVTGANITGMSSQTVTFTIDQPAPDISYVSPDVYESGAAVSLAVTNNETAITTSYAVTTGTLPSGLSLNTTTGLISGTVPTITTSSTVTVTITAYTGSSQGTATVSITYNPLPPVLTYTSPSPFTQGTAITPLSPGDSGGPVSTTGTYAGTVILKSTSGLNKPYGMAADASGDVFVVNYSGNSVTEYSAGGAITTTSISAAATGPVGLVFDASGNAYVLTGTKVIEYPGGNFAGTGTAIITGLNGATGIAIHGSTLYIANSGANNILEYSTAGGAPTLTITPPNDPLDVEASVSAGIAVDADGDIYVADNDFASLFGYFYFGSTVDEYSPSGAFIQPYETGNNDSALSIDATGDIYLTNIGAGSITVSTANFAATLDTETGFSSPRGTVADGLGDYFVADYNNNTVTEYVPVKGYYLVGTLPRGLYLNTTTGVVSGTPQTVFTSTTCTINAYNVSGKSTATFTISCNPNPPIIAYTPTTTVCTVGAPIIPPTLSVTGGPEIATGYTAGGALTGATLNEPITISTDPNGNMWVANFGGNTVTEFSSAGAFVKTVTLPTVGFGQPANPRGVVADAAGNFYVACTVGVILKYNSANTLQNTNTTIEYSPGYAYGMAMDAAGNIYISDPRNGEIWKYVPGVGTANPTVTVLVTKGTGGLAYPIGMATDGWGSVYAVDATTKSLLEFSAVTGQFSGTVVSGFNNPNGVCMDANGDYWVSDVGAATVSEYDDAGTLIPTGVITGLSQPYGVTISSTGTLYITSYNKNTVTPYTPYYYTITSGTLPAGLTFNNITGAFGGTPTATFPSTTLTVSAYGSFGNATCQETFVCNAYYDWIGTVSSDWNVPGNWAQGVVPIASDTARIGVSVAFTNQPTVSLTGATTVNIAQVMIGNSGGQAATLSAASGYTLAVAGNIIKLSDANSLQTYATASGLAGAGTITAANIDVVASTTQTAAYTETFSSAVTQLLISGNIALTSNMGTTYAENAQFNVTGGLTSLTSTGATGIVTTTNMTGSSSTIGVSGGTLQWVNATGLSGLSATGTNAIACSGTGVINYAGAAQTVYTDANTTGLPTGMSYQGVTFSGTGIKTPNGGNLNVAGNFTDALADDAADYVSLTTTPVFFNGTGAQSIAAGAGANGTIFNNVTFSGSGASTILSGMAYVDDSGLLTMGNNGATLNAGGFLTLVGDATGNASVAAITSGTPISGNVNVQRYVQGVRGYRTMSSPVNAGTTGTGVYSMNYLLNSMYLTGSGSGFTATGNPTLFLYDETFVPQYSTFYNSNFVAVSSMTSGTGSTPTYPVNVNGANLTGSYTVPVGSGFYVFYRGNLSEGTTDLTDPTYTGVLPSTITATGTLNQGQVTFADWWSPSSPYLSGASQYFNLVGNPYASAIDLSTIQHTSTGTGIYTTGYAGSGATATGVEKFIYELNPASNVYGIYTVGSGLTTNGASQYVASGQGFFVLAHGTNASQLIFNENAKATSTNANAEGLMARKVNLAALIPGVQNPLLRMKFALDTVNYEEFLITFDPKASSTYVQNEDAPHHKGQGLLGCSSSSTDNVWLSINSMPLQASQVIPVSISATNDGQYTFTLSQTNPLPPLFEVWLKDAYMKDSLDIKTYPTYIFNVVHADTASFGEHRFSLVIRENPALMLHLLAFNATKLGSGDNVTWSVENESNYTQFAVERSTDGGKTYQTIDSLTSNSLGSYSFLDAKPKQGANMYRLQLTDLNGLVSYSSVVTIMYANTGDAIALTHMMVYPNPTTGPMNLAITLANSDGALPSPSYHIQVTNNLGVVVKSVNSAQPVWQTDVSALMPGTYFVTVVNASNNTMVGRSSFVKL